MITTRRLFGMRLFSTPESADNLEPTVLAILETIAAMTLWVWLALHPRAWHLAATTGAV